MKDDRFWLVLIRPSTSTVVHVECPYDHRLSGEENERVCQSSVLARHPGFVFVGSRETNPDRTLPATDR